MEQFWEHLQKLTDSQTIIKEGGFYFLLIVIFAETGLFFGFFLPGDYLLVLAGILCASGMIEVSIYTLTISLILAGVLGNYTGYWFGYSTGPMLFKRNESFFFKKRYVTMAEEFYGKHGGMALVLGRFFPIIRTFAPIFAGVVKVNFKKFTLYNFIGSITWVCILTLAGFFLGKKYPDEIKFYLKYVILGLILVTSIPFVVAYLKKLLSKRKLKYINIIMSTQHPWHQVSPGDNIPDTVHAIIEIPKGSKAKYEIDKESGLLKLDRVLFSSVMYPANYGFIPKTYCDDHDPLDILVLCSVDVLPMSIIEAKVIGVMHMVDNGEQDDKIIAVAKNDMSVNYIDDLNELPPHAMKEIVRFFQDYKKLEDKNVTIEHLLGKRYAHKVIAESLELYKSTFPSYQ